MRLHTLVDADAGVRAKQKSKRGRGKGEGQGDRGEREDIGMGLAANFDTHFILLASDNLMPHVSMNTVFVKSRTCYRYAMTIFGGCTSFKCHLLHSQV